MNTTQTIETRIEPNYAAMIWNEDRAEEPATIETLTEDTPQTVLPTTNRFKMWGYEVAHTTTDNGNPTDSYHRVDLLPTGYGSTTLLATAHLSAENAGEISKDGIKENGLSGLAAKLQDKIPGLRHVGPARTVNYIFQEGNREPSERQVNRLQKVAYKALQKSNAELAEQINPSDIYIRLNGMGITAEVNRVDYLSKPLTKAQVAQLEARFQPEQVYELKETDMIEIKPSELHQIQYKPAQEYARAA